ncbi:hypothetical protein [Aquimarina algiphila]|uniref:hypothetical protein n=1 Tax=Aquimarina algiphila TaxID=2047982 RepID=UPI00232ED857|nr:hypothetical protein [Aquimarina algiphila]
MTRKELENKIDVLWDYNHRQIGTDIGDLEYYAGRDVMTRSDFERVIQQIIKEM